MTYPQLLYGVEYFMLYNI